MSKNFLSPGSRSSIRSPQEERDEIFKEKYHQTKEICNQNRELLNAAYQRALETHESLQKERSQQSPLSVSMRTLKSPNIRFNTHSTLSPSVEYNPNDSPTVRFKNRWQNRIKQPESSFTEANFNSQITDTSTLSQKYDEMELESNDATSIEVKHTSNEESFEIRPDLGPQPNYEELHASDLDSDVEEETTELSYLRSPKRENLKPKPVLDATFDESDLLSMKNSDLNSGSINQDDTQPNIENEETENFDDSINTDTNEDNTQNSQLNINEEEDNIKFNFKEEEEEEEDILQITVVDGNDDDNLVMSQTEEEEALKQEIDKSDEEIEIHQNEPNE